MKRTSVLVGMMFALLTGAFAQTSITYTEGRKGHRPAHM